MMTAQNLEREKSKVYYSKYFGLLMPESNIAIQISDSLPEHLNEAIPITMRILSIGNK